MLIYYSIKTHLKLWFCTAIGNLDHSNIRLCYTAEFKAEAVLEALRGESSQAELCRKPYNLSEEQFSNRSFYHTGVSPQTPSLGVRVSDIYGISTTNLILTLLNFGLNKRWHFMMYLYIHPQKGYLPA